MKTAWETLHTRINNQKIRVDERTMGSRDLIKELTQMDLNAQNAPNITDGTGLHFQKMSNLCIYFATMSAVRHEMKKIIGNSSSTAVNIHGCSNPLFWTSIPIPAGKLIDELFKWRTLSFEIMLSVLLGCVSPRALSGLVKTLNVPFKIVRISGVLSSHHITILKKRLKNKKIQNKIFLKFKFKFKIKFF